MHGLRTGKNSGRRTGTKTALIVVGRILEGEYERSLLYHPEFTTEFRQGKQEEQADE